MLLLWSRLLTVVEAVHVGGLGWWGDKSFLFNFAVKPKTPLKSKIH